MLLHRWRHLPLSKIGAGFFAWAAAVDMSNNSSSQVLVVPWLYWSLLPIHRVFLSLYFKQIIIHGFEHLPINGPVVFAPKHYSRWDPVVLPLLTLEPCRFMANENQFTGMQGWFIQRLGAFPVNLEHPKISSFRSTIALLQAHKKLMLFPEGGIVRDRMLRSLKPGLTRLVLQAEATMETSIPIVPIAIRYKPDAVWRATVTIHISPPLYSKDFRQEDEKQTAQALTQALEAALLKGLTAIGVSSPKHPVLED